MGFSIRSSFGEYAQYCDRRDRGVPPATQHTMSSNVCRHQQRNKQDIGHIAAVMSFTYFQWFGRSAVGKWSGLRVYDAILTYPNWYV